MRFTFALNVNAGRQISVVAPPEFILTCLGLPLEAHVHAQVLPRVP